MNRPASLFLLFSLLVACVAPAAAGPPLSGDPTPRPRPATARPTPGMQPGATARPTPGMQPGATARPTPGIQPGATARPAADPQARPAPPPRPWFHPAHSGKPYVNPDLTAERVLRSQPPDGWNGQLVLWQGRVRSMRKDGKATDLVLGTTAGDVPIRFRFKALNLETDRTGFRVAIKANLQIEQGRLVGLDGHSIILLQPPLERDYLAWLRAARGRTPSVESFLVWWIGFHNPGYPQDLCDTIASSIVSESSRNGLDPLFLASLVQIESAFRIDAVSTSGALGLGQLMPFIARAYGVDARNPRENLQASAKMISGLVRTWTPRPGARTAAMPACRTRHPWGLALASYNAGITRVRSNGGIPPIPQTTNYVYFIGFVHQTMTAAATRYHIPDLHARTGTTAIP